MARRPTLGSAAYPFTDVWTSNFIFLIYCMSSEILVPLPHAERVGQTQLVPHLIQATPVRSASDRLQYRHRTDNPGPSDKYHGSRDEHA